ncbi:MAG: response regulator [Eubacterium sp.]|nr:response regulator [Eubacterium sp.]
MREKKDMADLTANDSFLKKIRGQIRLLGFAAVAALFLIGLLALLTLWRSNTNNYVLNQMNIISNCQYEISSLNKSFYSSQENLLETQEYFNKMREAANNALEKLISPDKQNDIHNLSRDIDRLSENYDNMSEISSVRGFTTTQGYYLQYTENENKLYSYIVGLSKEMEAAFPDAQSYLDTLHALNTSVSDYTTAVMEGRQTNMTRWAIYGTIRSLEQRLRVAIFEHPELSQAFELISATRDSIINMQSLDTEYNTIHNNNDTLFERLLNTTDKIRSAEESGTKLEQNSLLVLMAIVILLLVTYLLIHTQILRSDLSQSIIVFNELLVAKASNDAQSSFLSTVSHEIRTPINAIMGMNEIIIRETNDKQIERYANEIKDSSRTLLSLVNDLLDSSRLDADRLKIIPVEYDLSSSISDLVNMITSRAREKNLNLFVNVNDTLPHVLFGDEIRIKQCVLNLLTNAVKYTETGSITLNVDYETVNRGSILLKFQVIDTGIGMKEEDLAHLYDRFSRFDEKKNRNIEGTGLGMNIVNRLLALMGTRLEVHSIYGRGSDFSFGVHQGVINWTPIGDYNTMYAKSMKDQKKYHEKLRAPAARVLIVDDMKVNLTVFKGLLKKTDIQIDTALSGKTAIELIKKSSYDIVFLDHRMPKMDGIETLINIKELTNNPNRNIPYIALTANAIAGARELYINAGFTDYLSKPIDSVELENLLIEYLPKDLVELQSYDSSYDDTEDNSDNTSSFSSSDDDRVISAEPDSSDEQGEDQLMHEILTHLEGIDYSIAIENCVDDETLIDAMSDFVQSMETKPGEIEQYWLDKDYRNYTIQVHALKSTARLIGAMQLSEDARYLEQCGDNENAEEIDAKTDALLDLYESYQEKLKPFIEARRAADEQTGSDEPISPEMFADAFGSVRELIDSFDFGNAEEVLKMLKNYNLTCEQQAKYDIMYKMIRNVDRDAILEWFKNTPDVNA